MKKNTLINWILGTGLFCVVIFGFLYINNINILKQMTDFWGPQQKKLAVPGFQFAAYGDGNNNLEYPVTSMVYGKGIYVVDQDAGNVKIFHTSGRYVDVFGNLESPYGIAEYGGNFYVSDMAKGKIIIFSKNGKELGELKLKNEKTKTVPGSLLVHDKYLYVADVYNGRIMVYDLPERILVRTLGTQGSGTGQLSYPHGMTVDTEGNLYVADSGNNRIVVFSKSGRYLRTIGGLEDRVGGITTVRGVAIDTKGNIYASAPLTGTIHVFDSNGKQLYTFGGTGEAEGYLGLPNELFIDAGGRLYITETKNKRVSVFER